MFEVTSTFFITAKDTWIHKPSGYYPCDCCGARRGGLLSYMYAKDNDTKIHNKGIHVWPTKVDVDAAMGEAWHVTLGGETFTTSLITDNDFDPEAKHTLTQEEIPQIHEKNTQTIYGVYFNALTEEPYPFSLSDPAYSYERYYGHKREVHENAFGRVRELLTPTSHCMFILTDEQLPMFDRVMVKHKLPVNIIKFPKKIVNRSYGSTDNPRLTLLYMTLDPNAKAL